MSGGPSPEMVASAPPAVGGDGVGPAPRPGWSPAWTWGLLLAGLLGGRAWLYGPSLAGRRLLAPTDLLVAPGPLDVVGTPRVSRPQHVMMDPVQVFLPWLDFAAREVRAGRLPTWNPH